MKPELEKILVEKYPKIFADYGKTPQESAMSWGLEVGDGWFNLIDNLCESLSHLYTTGVNLGDQRYVPLDAPIVVASQVKEKFGGLRFYYRLELPDTDKVKELKKQAETDAKVKEAIDDWSCDYIQFVDGIIYMAETISMRTCERTGLKGELHRTPGGWYKTLNKDYAILNRELVQRGYRPYSEYKQELLAREHE